MLAVCLFLVVTVTVHVTGAVGLGRTGGVWRLYSFSLLKKVEVRILLVQGLSPRCTYWRLLLAVHHCAFNLVMAAIHWLMLLR